MKPFPMWRALPVLLSFALLATGRPSKQVSETVPRDFVIGLNLLGRLDAALGPGAMQKSIFSIADDSASPRPVKNALLRDLAAGQFNDLFPGTTFTLSDLYKQAMNPPPQPSVEVVSTEPSPSASNPPKYPPLAKAAHVSGRVRFTVKVGVDGHLTDIQLEGHPLLKKSVEMAISAWTYGNATANATASGIIEFRNSCTGQTAR